MINKLKYWNRIFSTYFIKGKSNLSFWHGEPEINKDLVFATPNLSSLSATVATNITNSLSCNNGDQASGGEQAESIASIRENAVYNMGSQLRCVTLQDYQARIMSMPSQFGGVFRSFVRKDPNNSMGVEMFIVMRNSQKQLTLASEVIVNNIEIYIKNFKSFSDTIKLTSGRIINIGVDFTIVPDATANAQEALMECILVLQRLFDTARTNFNDSVVIPDIQARLQSLRKVRSIPNLKIVNKTITVGTRTYSGTEFNIGANTRNGILQFPQDSVWELKYPNFDIIGRPADQATAAAQGAAGAGGGGY